jgi:fatty acid desaturase
MTYWALTHETFHGVFHHKQSVSNAYGRVLSILFGAPFGVLRYGHLMHHRFNRTALDSSEVFDFNKTGRLWANMVYFFRLLIGLYLYEVLSCLMFLLPSGLLHRLAKKLVCCGEDEHPAYAIARRQLLEPANLNRMRMDSVIILFILGASFYLYGEYWPLLLLALAGRGMMISFFDNAFHYGVPLNDRHAAFNLSLPDWAAKLILNFNLHRVHHKYPGLSWHELPGAYDRENGTTEGSYLAVSLRQFRGPINQVDLTVPQTIR